MDTRLTDLEIRITHQEASIDELTDSLLAQQRQIDLLRRQVEALQNQLRDMETRGRGNEPEAPEPPPPHY
ncbi:MAG: SlyX family protein [Aquisalimonadaceae bacterium]